MSRLEDRYLDEYVRKLEGVGWVNGAGKYVIGYKERDLLSSYLIEGVLRDAILRINAQILGQLSAVDRELIVSRAIDNLKVSTAEYVLDYLKNGVFVSTEVSGHRSWSGKVRLIDYDNLGNNVFFYLKHPRFMGLSTREPDLVLYVNGIPIVVVEAKDPTKPNSHEEARTQIRTYEREVPELFKYVQIGVALGDDEYYTPTLPAMYDSPRHAYKWIVEGTRVSDTVQLLKPGTLLEFIRYFVYFREAKGGKGSLEKIVGRYNQYYAVKAIMRRIDDYLGGHDDRNRGLVWHWQGSGKTYIMFFAAKMFIDKYYGDRPLVFIIVDRRELEDQVQKMLNAIKDADFRSMFKRIDSIEDLHKVLSDIKTSEWNPNIIVKPTIYLVTIQKFARGNELLMGIDDLLKKLGSEYLERLRGRDYSEYAKIVTKLDILDQKGKDEELMRLGSITRRNILVLIDEAHRSQYGVLASMMRRALPNAVMIGFTGTPVLKYDKNTIKEFAYPERGELYLHVYSLGDSISDGFTVPIIYRVVKEGSDIKGGSGFRINLSEDEIKDLVAKCDEELESGESEDCEELLKEARLTKVVLANPNRIERIAQYIVENLDKDLGCDPADPNCPFKAMVVAANREACVYYKWLLDQYLVKKYGDKARDWVEVVMTYQVNDPEAIAEYRRKLIGRFGVNDIEAINRKIIDNFRESTKPRIVVVTDMLLTGFDAPNLKVMYLDKPLFEHRLLQAMARVNRPYKVRVDGREEEIKQYGVIVDFIGLVEYLVRSMMLYEMLAKEGTKGMENVIEDFSKRVVLSVNDEFRKFVAALNDVKRELRNIRLGLEGTVSIDIDELVGVMKREGREGRYSVSNMLNDVAAELAAFAAGDVYEEYPEDVKRVRDLLNRIVDVIRRYRALGAYPDKLKYEDDVKVLSILYGLVITKMSSTVKADINYFRRKLFEYIYDKTEVDELTEVAKITISEKVLNELMSKVGPREGQAQGGALGADIRWVRARIEELILGLKNELSTRPRDPIYRRLYTKLMDIVRRWATRAIEAVEAIKELREILRELESYEESMKNQPVSARVAYALSDYLSENYLGGRQVSLRFSNTRGVVDKLVARGSPLLPSDIKELKAQILKDILTELGSTMSSETKAKISRNLDIIVNEVVIPYIEGSRAYQGEGHGQ